jgi:hypothetical protein
VKRLTALVCACIVAAYVPPLYIQFVLSPDGVAIGAVGIFMVLVLITTFVGGFFGVRWTGGEPAHGPSPLTRATLIACGLTLLLPVIVLPIGSLPAWQRVLLALPSLAIATALAVGGVSAGAAFAGSRQKQSTP